MAPSDGPNHSVFGHYTMTWCPVQYELSCSTREPVTSVVQEQNVPIHIQRQTHSCHTLLNSGRRARNNIQEKTSVATHLPFVKDQNKQNLNKLYSFLLWEGLHLRIQTPQSRSITLPNHSGTNNKRKPLIFKDRGKHGEQTVLTGINLSAHRADR